MIPLTSRSGAGMSYIEMGIQGQKPFEARLSLMSLSIRHSLAWN